MLLSLSISIKMNGRENSSVSAFEAEGDVEPDFSPAMMFSCGISLSEVNTP